MIKTMKEKQKYEAPALVAVEFRTERGYATSFAKFDIDQAITQDVLSQLNASTEFNASGALTNQDMTEAGGSWTYTDGTWF